MLSPAFTRLACASLDGVACAVAALRSRACGFHDDVSIARGALNWTYPDALHVIGAISTAVMEKRLPHRMTESTAPDLFGSQYRATAKALERVGASLRMASGATPPCRSRSSWSSRCCGRASKPLAGELRTQIHAQGPQPGDLVVISGQNVIRAIADDRLAIGEAHGLGLIRLYGSEKQIAAFLDAFRDAGRERPASHDQTRRASDRGIARR